MGSSGVEISVDPIDLVLSCPGPVEKAIRQAAAAIAATAKESSKHEIRMRSTSNLNGLPVALVTIADPAGLAAEAKHGTLARAAVAHGLPIKRRRD